jgi:hypothetical protein
MPQVAHIARLGPAQFFSVISEKLLQPMAIAQFPLGWRQRGFVLTSIAALMLCLAM